MVQPLTCTASDITSPDATTVDQRPASTPAKISRRKATRLEKDREAIAESFELAKEELKVVSRYTQFKEIHTRYNKLGKDFTALSESRKALAEGRVPKEPLIRVVCFWLPPIAYQRYQKLKDDIGELLERIRATSVDGQLEFHKSNQAGREERFRSLERRSLVLYSERASSPSLDRQKVSTTKFIGIVVKGHARRELFNADEVEDFMSRFTETLREYDENPQLLELSDASTPRSDTPSFYTHSTSESTQSLLDLSRIVTIESTTSLTPLLRRL
ncbi:hypothetical protein D9758_006480 [Tetrapyrgos nigripes]|uniref:Uncharacterized protein n=1 Tax=Tetrapyrgos nigripes TaxID=182062 RepID=A0A8H5GKX7_9AGAR|nr:hypothetical protein D9758_006480 [Tetrapyrgos nigripes]